MITLIIIANLLAIYFTYLLKADCEIEPFEYIIMVYLLLYCGSIITYIYYLIYKYCP